MKKLCELVSKRDQEVKATTQEPEKGYDLPRYVDGFVQDLLKVDRWQA